MLNVWRNTSPNPSFMNRSDRTKGENIMNFLVLSRNCQMWMNINVFSHFVKWKLFHFLIPSFGKWWFVSSGATSEKRKAPQRIMIVVRSMLSNLRVGVIRGRREIDFWAGKVQKLETGRSITISLRAVCRVVAVRAWLWLIWKRSLSSVWLNKKLITFKWVWSPQSHLKPQFSSSSQNKTRNPIQSRHVPRVEVEKSEISLMVDRIFSSRGQCFDSLNFPIWCLNGYFHPSRKFATPFLLRLDGIKILIKRYLNSSIVVEKSYDD